MFVYNGSVGGGVYTFNVFFSLFHFLIQSLAIVVTLFYLSKAQYACAQESFRISHFLTMCGFTATCERAVDRMGAFVYV